MGSHPTHNMHENSLDVYADEGPKLQTRAWLILGLIKGCCNPVTARQLLDDAARYEGKTLTDMNYVRPRISELLKEGLIEECEEKVCDSVTGKKVSQFRVPAAPVTETQPELF